MKAGSTCFTSMPFKPGYHTWKGCDSSGQTTNAEDLAFMSKYGINKCQSSYYQTADYWADAVVQCGGADKIPTVAQLADLGNYLYNRTDLTSYKTGLTLDVEKASSLGFNNPSNGFNIWIAEGNDDTAHIAWSWSFGTTRFGQNYGSSYSDTLAICVE